MNTEKDYVLGTHLEEVERLGIQHRAWRAQMLDAWQRAGFRAGQRLLDLGCGPGYASLDLAEQVGPTGHVIGIDRSRRFLDVLDDARDRLGLTNITTCERDLDQAQLPKGAADGAWVRWVFAFVTQPRDLVARLHTALKPGACVVIHEYFDYTTWRAVPRCAELEAFVSVVIDSWRANGGEPDIALSLPSWLEDVGFEVTRLHPIIDVVSPTDAKWQWLMSFVESGRQRLVELGDLSQDRSRAMGREVAALASKPGARMITPGVLEIIAVRSSL
ncbi:MAG: methyltransferase domain-containing protein [Longimicrobiales bacterium]